MKLNKSIIYKKRTTVSKENLFVKYLSRLIWRSYTYINKYIYIQKGREDVGLHSQWRFKEFLQGTFMYNKPTQLCTFTA